MQYYFRYFYLLDRSIDKSKVFHPSVFFRDPLNWSELRNAVK